jgi:hypothetical protein
LTIPDLPTPTYTKPTIRNADGSLRELERLDIVAAIRSLPRLANKSPNHC